MKNKNPLQTFESEKVCSDVELLALVPQSYKIELTKAEKNTIRRKKLAEKLKYMSPGERKAYDEHKREYQREYRTRDQQIEYQREYRKKQDPEKRRVYMREYMRGRRAKK